MEHTYYNINKPIENVLLKEKGSKFIGYAYPTISENEVKFFLEKIKAEHPKASHYCYAFRMGLNGELYRANDDGEPSGSAGLPIYNQLLAHQLTNILLVVVRFFGGTKLGVSGLVKAYKETAKLTLSEAEIVLKEAQTIGNLSFYFKDQNLAFNLLNKYQAEIQKFLTDELCSIDFCIKTSRLEEFITEVGLYKDFTYSFKK